METLWQDLRYSLRALAKQPGYAAVVIVTLALGIGVNTAMFSVLNTYLFRSLPYPQADRLVRVFRTSPHSQSWPHSPGNFFSHNEENEVFDYMAAYNYVAPNLANPGEPAERLRALAVSADFFYALGVEPQLGRVFQAAEHEAEADRVAILSHRYWQNRYGGDAGVLGQTMRLDGRDIEIVGVMPADFEHSLLWGPIDLWRPLAFTVEGRRLLTSNYLRSFGRLKPGVSIEQADESMKLLAANLSRQNTENTGESLRLEPLQRSTSDDVRRNVMWFTFALSGFVLLIACANLANLQLVRAAARSREYAVRAALGAGRARLLRQSLTESLIIALIGGGFSLLLAFAGVKFISNRLFSELPGAAVTLDLSVFSFTLVCSLLTGVLFGVVPAFLASRADVNQALRQNARGSTAGRSQHRLRHLLIVGEVAFALVLLAGAGLFLRGLQRFTYLEPGWRVDNLVTAQIGLQGANYSTPAARLGFYQKLEERLAALPGVEKVALSSSLPVWDFNSSGSFRVEGEPEPAPGEWPEVFFEPVTTDYFATLGAQFLAGRAFTAADTADSKGVVIINETMAKHFWHGESPIGKRIGRPGSDPRWQEIVGVIRDLDFPASLSQPYTQYQLFRPLAQAPANSVHILLRTASSSAALTPALRAAAAELDATQAVHRVRTARYLIDQGLGGISLLGTLLGAFAALGLVLATVGIYGVTSYSVVQRTGEIGIRMALGAGRRNILWLVLGKGGRLILAGALLGIAGAYGVTRLLAALIPELPTRDPAALVFVTVILVFVALLACYLPARRATRVDPMIALRHE